MIHLYSLFGVRAFLRRLVSWGNLVAFITILIGILASVGLLDRFATRDAVLLGVLTLLATQILVDRVGILSDIRQMLMRGRKYEVELKPRTDPTFERFSDFAKGAKEVFVVGVDLGFLANADAYFVREALARGVVLKLMVCNPTAGEALGQVLDAHDERNRRGLHVVHDHLKTAGTTVATLRALAEEAGSGSLEIRARVDIPAPTLTMIDPRSRDGKIRVELKPYKNNHGEVPYFLIDRTNVWYEVFFDRYYTRLWEDSPVLYSNGVSSSPMTKADAESVMEAGRGVGLEKLQQLHKVPEAETDRHSCELEAE